MCCAFLCVGKQHQARIRRLLRLCALRAPLCPGHTARSLRNASIPTSLLTSPVVPTNKKAHQDDVLFLLYGTIYGREPENLFSAFGGCLQTLALCTVCNFADTLRRFAVYLRFALCRAALLNHSCRFGGCLQTLAFSFNSFDAFNYFSEFLLKIYVY